LLRRLPSSLKILMEKTLDAISPHYPCPACEQEEISRRTAVRVLAASLNDQVFAEAFKAFGGVCLPHLRLVLQEVRDPQALEILLFTSHAKWSALRSELAEIIRKNDYRYRHEAFGPEGDAWKRVVALVVGGNPDRLE
jgi:hypothetical protein